MEGLSHDLKRWTPDLLNKKLVSIYFGGGTPALLSPDEIHTLIDSVQRIIPFDRNTIEITLVANPENLTYERMKGYAEAGVNRISIGVQSLDDQLLKKLGRTHDAATAVNAIESINKAGISNISIDLMYDIPMQTIASWHRTLNLARELPITHLSLYNLTIEPNTVFFKYRNTLIKELPGSDCSTEMYKDAVSLLEEKGLKQYEISAFARNGQISIHNTGYWTGRPFLGFGPSAFSYWEGKRFRATANLNRYTQSLKAGDSPIDFSEELEPIPHRRELLVIALRLRSGVDITLFEKTHGSLEPITHEVLKLLQAQNLIEIKNNFLVLTEKGILFYDTVASELI